MAADDPEDQATAQLPTGGASGGGSAYRALLKNRNFRNWFSAAFASSLGDWTGFFALQTLVTTMNQEGSRATLFALGGVMMARLAPSLIIGPVAGVLADRYDRKRLMVATDLLRGGLFVFVALSRNLATLLTLTFVVEALSLLFISAKDSSLPTLVKREQLTEANQLNLLVTYGTLPLGALVATTMVAVAALLRTLGIDSADATVIALLVDAATFFIAAGFNSRLVLPAAERRRLEEQDKPGVIAELREGLDFINSLPLIRSLILGVVGVFFGAGVVVAIGPEFVRASLGRPPTDWFVLASFVGVGLVVGIIGVPRLTKNLPKERVFPYSLAALGAIATVMAFLPSFVLTTIMGLGLGVAAGASFVLGYTLLHEHTEDATRGKTFAAFYTGTRVSMLAAFGLAPFLAGFIGSPQIILGQGTQLTISGLRLVIGLGGIVALYSALRAGRGMRRAMREGGDRAVKLANNRRAAHVGGMFIVFEGVEGSGKSTQVRALADTLEAEGRAVVVTREPGGSPVAERIRELLLDPNAEGMQSRTEALLYAAARAEHVTRVVRPALEAGKVVVCDRYVDSSLAYQGYARELGPDDVFEINRWAIDGVLPDVVVLLHLEPEEGLRRVADRARRRRGPRALVDSGVPPSLQWTQQLSADRLEREGLAFHRKVADGYLALARKDRDRFVVVDGAADAETVARQVRKGLHAWVPLVSVARQGVGDDHGNGEDSADTPRPEVG